MNDSAAAAQLALEAWGDGIALWVDDSDTIKARGPNEALSRYRERIRANKAALISYLRPQTTTRRKPPQEQTNAEWVADYEAEERRIQEEGL